MSSLIEATDYLPFPVFVREGDFSFTSDLTEPPNTNGIEVPNRLR